MTSTRIIARNTLLNLAGQIAPLIAAVVAIPILIRGLGPASFAILTLSWTAIGYFSLFDLGLGRALTHAVATRIGTDEEDLAAVSWTALVLMVALGVVGAIVLYVAAPWLAYSLLRIPPELQADSKRAFEILALSLPAVIMTAGLRGVMEAHQDFGLATALRLPLAVFTFLGPVALLPFTHSVSGVVGVLVFGRLCTWMAHLGFCLRRYPFLKDRMQIRLAMIPPLVRFGGWMTVSNIVSPLMVSMDRFLIGAILPMVAVAEYVTPYEVVTKIFLIPQAFLGVLFPALASAFVRDPRRAATLFERGVRTIALLVFPAVLTIVLFAHEGLQLWVGADFASASTSVLQILAVGVFINAALGQVGFTLLQGAARPDITARAHLIELPFYAAAIWWLTRQIGLPGVALTWTLRVSVDAAVLMYLSVRLAPVSRAEISRVAGTMFLSLAALAGAAAVHGLTVKCVYLGVTLAAFATLGWRRALTPGEREGLVAWLRAGGKPVAVGALGAD